MNMLYKESKSKKQIFFFLCFLSFFMRGWGLEQVNRFTNFTKSPNLKVFFLLRIKIENKKMGVGGGVGAGRGMEGG